MNKNINGIQFNSIKQNGIQMPAWPILLKNQIGPDSDGGVINAVDIDWNDAVLNIPALGEIKTITTTADLLKVIEELGELIDVKVQDITLDNSLIYLPYNSTTTITANIEPNNVRNKDIYWSVSDYTVAGITPITKSGEPATITWRNEGTVKIMAHAAADLSKFVYCDLICKAPNYLYIGTTKPTSILNAHIVDSYSLEYMYTNNSGNKSHIFVLTNEEKHVKFIDTVFNNYISDCAVDTTSIPGYNIFETAVGVANESSIKIAIY